MVIATFPRTIYTSFRHFNAYTADNMQHGDLTESILKKQFQLFDISNVVDPYTMVRKTAFNTSQSRFAGIYGDTARGNTMTIRECARLLFNEIQTTSLPYTCIGPYRHIFQRMLTHFQHAGGLPYNDFQLNTAYSSMITPTIAQGWPFNRNSMIISIMAKEDTRKSVFLNSKKS